jgi:lipopolysaccharide export system protein LptA
MKRISKILLLLVLTVFVPLSMVSGQDKKTEQKVKVVISDKDGEMTVIDTTFTGDAMPHSITVKDGKVVYFASPQKGNIYVTSTDGEDGTLSHQEKVIVISGDNAEWTASASTGTKQHIYINTDGKSEKGGNTEKHIIVASAGGNAVWSDKDGKTFHVTVDSDADSDIDTNTDVTKYVIAKDGVVITVESQDEDKAKDILEVLEKELKIKK